VNQQKIEMSLSDEEISRIAAAVAEAITAKQCRFKSPVLTTDEAMVYVGKRSTKSFKRWCKKWAVKQCDTSRYSKRQLEYGLNKESKQTYRSNSGPRSSKP